MRPVIVSYTAKGGARELQGVSVLRMCRRERTTDAHELQGVCEGAGVLRL